MIRKISTIQKVFQVFLIPFVQIDCLEEISETAAKLRIDAMNTVFACEKEQ